MSDERITVLGAGLVGSLMAVFLRQRGFQVQIFEKREDLRQESMEGGRSINLALSHRGLSALDKVGLLPKVKQLCLPMEGRMIHSIKGDLNLQPYGNHGQYINSISRQELNVLLMDTAESMGAGIYFNEECCGADLEQPLVYLKGPNGSQQVKSDFVIGADGAFSGLREAMRFSDRFNFSQYYLTHGYKELTMPATGEGDFALDPGALHIWPREQFMLIALPNLDRSFTCTLFLPFEGPVSFEQLQHQQQVLDFFEKWFSDALPLIPELTKDFFANPTSSMVTIRCNPWQKGRAGLIGDASHAIVPFYGQGMNAGFEDCRILDEMLNEDEGNFADVFSRFQQKRIPDTDAIAELAFGNFIEMRDLVDNDEFILRKKIETKIHQRYPEEWIPLYSMVTFSDRPYSEALRIGALQQKIMDKVLAIPNIHHQWETLDLGKMVKDLKEQMALT